MKAYVFTVSTEVSGFTEHPPCAQNCAQDCLAAALRAFAFSLVTAEQWGGGGGHAEKWGGGRVLKSLPGWTALKLIGKAAAFWDFYF